MRSPSPASRAGVLALVSLAAFSAAAHAASPAGPGCDRAGPVVAHHAAGRPAQPPGGAPLPIACATETGYATSESKIAATSAGVTLYSPAHTENSLTRSLDQGAGWSLTAPADEQYTSLWNTVDPDLVVDRRTDRVFWVHATGGTRTAPVLVSESPFPRELSTAIAYASGFQVYSSSDGGRGWRTADYQSAPMGDWEKVFVGPPPSPVTGAAQPTGYPDVVYVCANSPFEVSGPGRLCYRSLDGGATFEVAGYVFPSPSSPVDTCPALATNFGVVGNDGTTYQPVSCSSGAYLAVSRDEGSTYTYLPVKDAPASDALSGSLQVVIDAADDLYATWVKDDKLFLAVSRDRGQSWGAPIDITAPGVHKIARPAPAAGPRGQVGVAYYASRDASAERLTAYVTETTDALDAAPVLYSAALNDPGAPIFNDFGLSGPSPRADYVGATIDPSGTFWAGMVKQLGPPDANKNVATTGYVGRLLLAADSGPPAPGGARANRRPACGAGRRLTFRIGRVPGGRVVRASVFVNGRRLLTRRARDLRRVSFARPTAGRLVVRIVTTNNRRGRVVTVRVYRRCSRGPLHTRHQRHRRR